MLDTWREEDIREADWGEVGRLAWSGDAFDRALAVFRAYAVLLKRMEGGGDGG